MAAVTESEIYSSIRKLWQTALLTIDTATFVPTNSPAFEGSGTAFPNGRTEKFVDLTPSSQYYTYDGTWNSMDSGILSIWIKPDFNQAGSNSRYINAVNSGKGMAFYFDTSIDDFGAAGNNLTGGSPFCSTAGLTWSADSVHHIVFIWSNTAGLDNGKSLVIYFDNVLQASTTTTWSSGQVASNDQRIGRSDSQGWDGGFFEWAFLNYDTLSSTHTDAEIVQALYSNTFNSGTTHKFVFETTGVPAAPSGLYIDTITTTACTLHWTDNSSNETGFKIYRDGLLIDTIATPGTTSYNATGLSPNTTYYFSVTAYNGDEESTHTSDVYIITQGPGISITAVKARIRTGSTPTTAVEISTTQGVGLSSTLDVTGATTLDSTLSVTGETLVSNKLKFTQIDGNEYIDSLADGYIDAEATTGIRLRINGTEQVNLTDGVLAPTTDNDIDLGSSTKEYKNVYIDGVAYVDELQMADSEKIRLGTGQDVHMYYDGTNMYLETDKVAASDLKIDCGTDKTIELVESVWDDLRTPANALRLPASNPPQEFAYKGGTVLAFEDEAVKEDIIYFTLQLPHNYKQGTDIIPHVHWVPEDNTGGNVKWAMTYTWANIDGTFAAEQTVYGTGAAGTTADKHLMTNLTALSGSGKTLSSMLICSLRRNSTSADDTYTGKDALFLEIDFHYEIDTIGSRTVGAK